MGSEHLESDRGLLRAARSGDRQAFDALVRRYRQTLLCLAQRITKNREDAEDVVQESFCKAYLNLNSFQQRARFSTWLTRIAINESLMVRRRRRSLSRIDIDSSDAGSQFVADLQPSSEVSCWRHERAWALRKAINRLGPSVRTELRLLPPERINQKLLASREARLLGYWASAFSLRLPIFWLRIELLRLSLGWKCRSSARPKPQFVTEPPKQEHGDNRCISKRTQNSRLHQSVVVDHSSDCTNVNQAVEQLPAAPAKAADPTSRRGNRERNQEHKGGKSQGDVRPFGNAFPHFRQVKKFVEPDVCGEMQATIKKGEKPKHAPEADQIRQTEEFPEGRDAEGD